MNPLPSLQQAIDKLIPAHNLAVETLTEAQLASAIRQAIEAGDFMRNVRIHDDSQAVIYLPGYGNDSLREANAWITTRVVQLESYIQSHGLPVPPDGREDD